MLPRARGGEASDETEIIIRLIQSDECNVAAEDYYGWTTLIGAVKVGKIELVRLLLQKGASNIDSQPLVYHRITALMHACENGDASIVELLIRNGATFDLKDNENRTAFEILEEVDSLSQAEKTRLKDLPRLVKQEQAR